MKKTPDITIIGAAILDILAGPAGPSVFQTGSQAMNHIKMSFGGDALNEAIALSYLEKKVELITKIGNDDAGKRILDGLCSLGISTDRVIVEDGLETGINIVLVDDAGERHFLTNPYSSLRRLSEQDILSQIDAAERAGQLPDLVCFASIFVSPLLDAAALTRIFRRLKEKPGRILVADMTKAKKGETLQDLKEFLPYIDYLIPNEEEIALLTGVHDPYENARLLNEAGLACAVIKRGKKGCLIRTSNEMYEVPAFLVEHPVDTTGAGDCFAAGFLFALSEGCSLADCGKYGCAVAARSVKCLGATDGLKPQ